MHFNILSLTGLAVLYLTPVVSAYAVASPVTQASVPDDDKSLKSLEDAFAVLQVIPDEVLEAGDEAKTKWVQEHYPGKGETGLEKRADIVEIGQCAREIATNVPAAKLLKLKKILKKLGGIKKAIKKLFNARKNPKAARGAVKELIDFILGISDIKKECWDDFK
ncbi:MAG: hypothetical protein M1816_004270 [Peltula sp. TS41687]|nr:MAG: hypothetical protein M1816_004270 [Peltula sp. TS41687]